MKLTANFVIAAGEHSGFSAEQVLYNRGFAIIGRRTNAAAWTKPDADEVIRISNDAPGSEAYFNLAQKMKGNPYMPVVYHHTTLKSGDHIAHVEKLENPSQKHLYQRLITIEKSLAEGTPVSVSDVGWREEMRYTASMTATLSNFFMARNSYLDIDTLPAPAAFREAATAITELALDMHKSDRRYVPSPDMNPTNIMWRRIDNGLVPVLYDPLVRQYDNGPDEKKHAEVVRARLALPAQNP